MLSKLEHTGASDLVAISALEDNSAPIYRSIQTAGNQEERFGMDGN